jgi:tetratricopeptide (TPR) repeat protein
MFPPALGMLFAASLATSSGALAQSPRLGTIHFPTSAKGTAQQAFVTGVLLMHSFEYPRAAAAFRQAQHADPRFAMAYWGEAMTYTHPVWNQQDTAAGRAVLRRLAPTAQARAAYAPTTRERAYLAAVETLYGEGTKERRDTAYARAMERLSTEYPRDAEARAFYALALLGLSQGQRDVPTYMRAGAIAESLFVALPQHPGAAHYVIHAFDDPVHAPLGLRAARAYATIAPDAAHAQHMTSHIFLALGMWDETAHANEVATVATRDTTTTAARGRCGHYAEWLQYAYLQQGRPNAAATLVRECQQQSVQKPSERTRGSFLTMRAAQLIESEAWSSDLATMSTSAVSVEAVEQATAAFASGYAAAWRGDSTRARAELASLTASTSSLHGAERAYAEIDALELRALLSRDNGAGATAIELLTQAIAIEDSLPVDFGPPIDIKPPRELLGELLLKREQATQSQAAFEAQLKRTPRRALSLLGLAKAASAAGKTDITEAANAELQRVRHRAEALSGTPAR